MQLVDLNSRNILVTGGTGSFGRAFINRVLSNSTPDRIVVYSRDELKQYEMQQALRQKFPADKLHSLRFFIGDVRDQDRLRMATRNMDYVVHAAALKQVPAAEYNPMECIKTNIMGAENVIAAALDNDVEKVVALSTDKACNPINLYGATKLASDKSFVAANNLVGRNRRTRFAVVRYGNVIGSRGSVVPFFAALAKQNADIPITDERMTRFWITLEQGVDFVLSTFPIMQGGEIFVPKIPSVNIMQLANVIAPNCKTHTVGIRPGEKLHEVMISVDDAYITVDLGSRYAIEPAFDDFARKPLSETLGATKVPDRFTYSSDTNPDMLDDNGLRKLLAEAGY